MAVSAIPYTPLTAEFGGVVEAVTVATIVAWSDVQFESFRDLVHRLRLVVFRGGNSTVTPEDQLALSRRLGTIHSTFYRHPGSPDPDIFRVSNVESVGCTHVGRSGWHNDGTFLDQPGFDYQTMHFLNASRHGFTQFIPLRELLLSQPPEQQAAWRRLRYLVAGNNGRGLSHPLVYPHRATGEPTMLFHLGEPFCGGWLVASETDGQPPRRAIPGEFISQLQSAIDAASHPTDLAIARGDYEVGGDNTLEGKKTGESQQSTSTRPGNSRETPAEGDGGSQLVHTMRWQQNDFAVIDNAAMAHYAVPATQLSAAADGLRVLHRTTVIRETQQRVNEDL